MPTAYKALFWAFRIHLNESKTRPDETYILKGAGVGCGTDNKNYLILLYMLKLILWKNTEQSKEEVWGGIGNFQF